MRYATRFAPSPTGPLHLGHAFSAILAHDRARANGGQFYLRIEDIDQTRSKPEWEKQISDDLTWLGLTWDGPVLRQSERLEQYRHALERLAECGLLFACTCKRRDILAAISAPQEGAPLGPDGLIYPGTCRERGRLRNLSDAPPDTALRLNMARALDALGAGADLSFVETGIPLDGAVQCVIFRPDDALAGLGDIVLSRRDFLGSYHLSVVLDDAAQGVTEVVRGADLFEATKIHVILQRLLDLPAPVYHHHRLIRDAAGVRLAKRDNARAISAYRAEGYTAKDVRRLLRPMTSAT